MLDYVVVGLGLAGVSLCETLEKNRKSFQLFSNTSQTSSIVAGGLYNPVILKRFTLAWNAAEQLKIALPFYAELEKKLRVKLDHQISVLRRFASIEEQNLWFQAADRKALEPFLSATIIPNHNTNIDAPFGYGQVLDTGRIDTEKLITAYGDFLDKKNNLVWETFDHNALQVHETFVEYKSYRAKHIIFAEGFGLKQNPYFNYLPLNGTKGELLTIRATNLKEDNIIKSSVFIIPLGDDLYRIGATYKWKDKTNTPTEESKLELLEKLDSFLKCDYTVEEHVAGIRPTVTDRRPLVGQHPENKNLYVLNGLGSRGVLIAPYASGELYQFIERQKPLHQEMDISRFLGKYCNA